MVSGTGAGNLIPFYLTRDQQHVPPVLKGIAGIRWFRKNLRSHEWTKLTYSLISESDCQSQELQEKIESVQAKIKELVEKEPSKYLSDPSYSDGPAGEPILIKSSDTCSSSSFSDSNDSNLVSTTTVHDLSEHSSDTSKSASQASGFSALKRIKQLLLDKLSRKSSKQSNFSDKTFIYSRSFQSKINSAALPSPPHSSHVVLPESPLTNERNDEAKKAKSNNQGKPVVENKLSVHREDPLSSITCDFQSSTQDDGSPEIMDTKNVSEDVPLLTQNLAHSNNILNKDIKSESYAKAQNEALTCNTEQVQASENKSTDLIFETGDVGETGGLGLKSSEPNFRISDSSANSQECTTSCETQNCCAEERVSIQWNSISFETVVEIHTSRCDFTPQICDLDSEDQKIESRHTANLVPENTGEIIQNNIYTTRLQDSDKTGSQQCLLASETQDCILDDTKSIQ